MTICRVCLCSKPRKNLAELYLFENGEKRSSRDVMLFCLGIQIDSNMSTKLCVKCFRKIIEFYHFKTLAVKSDAQLRSFEAENTKTQEGEVFLTDDDLKKENLTADSDYEKENVVFLTDDDIKKEKLTADSDCENEEESLIPFKEDEPNFDANTMNKIKEEYKQEDQSEDELLSVIKKVEYNLVKETENERIKKKRGRPKKPKPLTQETKSKICEECGKKVINLRAHMLKHIPLELRKHVKCELCDKVFSSNSVKRKHITRKHLAVKKQCHLCDKSVANLKQHILTMHNTESLPFQCVPCGRRFISQGRLDSHLTVHTKDRPFGCDMCASKFRLKLSLVMHKRQVHDKEKSHLCQFCSKSFFKKHHLHVHLRSHTNEKPYPCPECGKHFQSSTTLKNHRLTHSKEKNYNCTLCDMSFSTNNYLRAHQISHTKEKRYPCQYCDVKFHRSDHRKRHEYTAHLRNAVGST